VNNLFNLIIILLPVVAYSYLIYIYTKYNKINKSISSFEITKEILNKNDLEYVHIVKAATLLPSHYDTRRKVIRLSSNIYDKNDLVSLTVATHESYHAVLYFKHKTYNDILSFMFPLFNLIAKFCYPIMFISILFNDKTFFDFSILLILSIIIYQIFIIYSEKLASNNAKILLKTKFNNDEKYINNILFITDFVFITLPIKYLIDYINIFLKKIKG
jgi:uncharacterized protein